MSLGKGNKMNLSDFSDIFGGNSSRYYKIDNISEEELNIYKQAYKVFKENYSESKANINLDLKTNTLNINNFDGINMFYFGKIIGKIENDNNRS